MTDFEPLGRPPKLLPQRSAYYWGWKVARLMFTAMADVLLLAVGWFVLPPPLQAPVIAAATITEVTIAVVGFYWSLRWMHATAKERRAGYTTLPEGRADRWQLDPKTGEVLRAPIRKVK